MGDVGVERVCFDVIISFFGGVVYLIEYPTIFLLLVGLSFKIMITFSRVACM